MAEKMREGKVSSEVAGKVGEKVEEVKGKMSCVTQKKETFETGPYEEKCIHYPHGTDEIYHRNVTYYQVCGSCGYKSGTWTVDEGESLRYCHGWSATKH